MFPHIITVLLFQTVPVAMPQLGILSEYKNQVEMVAQLFFHINLLFNLQKSKERPSTRRGTQRIGSSSVTVEQFADTGKVFIHWYETRA